MTTRDKSDHQEQPELDLSDGEAASPAQSLVEKARALEEKHAGTGGNTLALERKRSRLKQKATEGVQLALFELDDVLSTLPAGVTISPRVIMLSRIFSPAADNSQFKQHSQRKELVFANNYPGVGVLEVRLTSGQVLNKTWTGNLFQEIYRKAADMDADDSVVMFETEILELLGKPKNGRSRKLIEEALLDLQSAVLTLNLANIVVSDSNMAPDEQDSAREQLIVELGLARTTLDTTEAEDAKIVRDTTKELLVGKVQNINLILGSSSTQVTMQNRSRKAYKIKLNKSVLRLFAAENFAFINRALRNSLSPLSQTVFERALLTNFDTLKMSVEELYGASGFTSGQSRFRAALKETCKELADKDIIQKTRSEYIIKNKSTGYLLEFKLTDSVKRVMKKISS